MVRPMRRLLVLAAVGLLCACAKAPPPKKLTPPKPKDPAELVADLLHRAYGAVESKDSDALTEVFEPDAMIFGLSPADTFNSRQAFMDTATKELQAFQLSGDSLAFSESHPEVGLADGAQSGWLDDFPKAVLTSSGTPSTWLPRITAHAVKTPEGWRFDAMHLSLGVPDAKTFAPDGARKYLPPFAIEGERGKDSEQVIGLTKRMLEDIVVKVERISDRDEVLLLGTDPGDVYAPGKKFKDLVKPRLHELKKGYVPVKLDGPLRSKLAPDGKTGWVAANIVVKTNTGKKVQTLPVFRSLWIFDNESEVWDIVSEHQSLALKPEQRDPATADELKAREQRRAEAKPATKSTPAPAKPSKAKDDGISTFE